jgi:hypothetical protein
VWCCGHVARDPRHASSLGAAQPEVHALQLRVRVYVPSWEDLMQLKSILAILAPALPVCLAACAADAGSDEHAPPTTASVKSAIIYNPPEYNDPTNPALNAPDDNPPDMGEYNLPLYNPHGYSPTNPPGYYPPDIGGVYNPTAPYHPPDIGGLHNPPEYNLQGYYPLNPPGCYAPDTGMG